MFSRKNQRRDSETPSTLPIVSLASNESLSRHNTSQSSRSRFSLRRTLTRSSMSSSQAEEARGALGLNLLYSAPAPTVDLIFVHGLGGGSRKTWSKSSSPSHFWPKEWLSNDPAFQSTRIHSYGYDSNYLSGKEDRLNIHHFGKSFLGAISTSPYIANSGTRIVVVGHSMGGLVMKKAYILAKQDNAHQELSKRFATFFFLASPHRGSGSATTLKNILKFAYDRAYVGDLEPKSGALEVINDEFRHVSAFLELWSFYETQHMKLLGSLVVEIASATLGYPGEQQVPMAADHRTICKYDTPEDPNYVTLRNSLATVVSKYSSVNPQRSLRQSRESLKDVKEYLSVSDNLDDDYANSCETRMHGSCEWISRKPAYQNWKDGDSEKDKILWVKGKPATGKSVLAGYIINQLKDSGHACSYFFFKHGDRSKATVGSFLRSMALQMACSHSEAMDSILELKDDGVSLDRADERTLWRKLFVSNILKANKARHYWVIDALDECSNFPILLNNVLSHVDASMPIRILITGRDAVELDPGFSNIPHDLLQKLAMSTSDTKSDIKMLVQSKIKALGVLGPNDRETLAESILEKSKGSFLWTSLVLNELVHCHSMKEFRQVLEDVPRGMEPLYKRILDSMSRLARGKELAKTILVWATCAIRPLTLQEMNGALTLDIHDSFPRLEDSISALCGQLVRLDKHDRVKMVHETAREFLLTSPIESEFSIEKSQAHTKLAQVCLKYLIADEMKAPRSNRRRSSANPPTKRLEFAQYAYIAFSYHLSKSQPSSRDTLNLLIRFLKSNVLTWIETISELRSLNHLITVSKHLRSYANACAAERSPLDPQLQIIRQWVTDLARIPAMFANALATSPAAVYSLIPPFCPTESMIFTIGASDQRLQVLGSPRKQWDERILCIDSPQGQPKTICYGDEFLAVGLSSGAAILYYATSYQEYISLEHGEAVSFVAFKPQSDYVVTCGSKVTKIWNYRTGEAFHKFVSPSRPLGVEWNGDSLLIASRSNYIATWDLSEAAPAKPVRRPWTNTGSPEASEKPLSGTPCAFNLSISHGILAVAYSGQFITIWDVKEDIYVGSCGKRLSNGSISTHIVVALVMNPNPDIELLAISYLDGDLAIIDPFSNRQVACLRANCQTLASSPNGRLLAAGSTNGIIQIYEFDTLNLLYQVHSTNSFIKQMAFTPDNLRLADIRGSQCTVWEPEVLLREFPSDGSSASAWTPEVEKISTESRIKATAIAIHDSSRFIFCGKDDGSVTVYERQSAASMRTLFNHKSTIRSVAWIKRRDSLLSIDASNRIFLHQIRSSASGFEDPKTLFMNKLDSQQSISDVLVGEKATKFLISTRENDYLFDLNTGQLEKEKPYSQIPKTRKWFQHPESSEHLVCVDSSQVCIYRWSDLHEVSMAALTLEGTMGELKNVTLHSFNGGHSIILNYFHPAYSVNKISILSADVLALNKINARLLDADHRSNVSALHDTSPDQDSDTEAEGSYLTVTLCSWSTTFELKVVEILGVDRLNRLIFLNRSFWVCSVDLNRIESNDRDCQLESVEVSHHFFIPFVWFAGRKEIVGSLVENDIILTRGGDLAVIRGGLSHVEKICTE